MKKLLGLLTVSIALVCTEALADVSLKIAYLEGKITAYESRLQECMLMGRNAGLPDGAVLTALQAYPQEQMERFLIIQATLAEEKCVSMELGDLATALLTIEAAEHKSPEDMTTLINEIKPAVFSSTRWELQQHYLSLPPDMKKQMEEFEAFQQPFNSLLIREHLYD